MLSSHPPPYLSRFFWDEKGTDVFQLDVRSISSKRDQISSSSILSHPEQPLWPSHDPGFNIDDKFLDLKSRPFIQIPTQLNHITKGLDMSLSAQEQSEIAPFNTTKLGLSSSCPISYRNTLARRTISLCRRKDNDYVNGTKLLNIAEMSRGKRDSILKNEKEREVVKSGSMRFKGVWIPLSRAIEIATACSILDRVFPLLEALPESYVVNHIPLPKDDDFGLHDANNLMYLHRRPLHPLPPLSLPNGPRYSPGIMMQPGNYTNHRNRLLPSGSPGMQFNRPRPHSNSLPTYFHPPQAPGIKPPSNFQPGRGMFASNSPQLNYYPGYFENHIRQNSSPQLRENYYNGFVPDDYRQRDPSFLVQVNQYRNQFDQRYYVPNQFEPNIQIDPEQFAYQAFDLNYMQYNRKNEESMFNNHQKPLIHDEKETIEPAQVPTEFQFDDMFFEFSLPEVDEQQRFNSEIPMDSCTEAQTAELINFINH